MKTSLSKKRFSFFILLIAVALISLPFIFPPLHPESSDEGDAPPSHSERPRKRIQEISESPQQSDSQQHSTPEITNEHHTVQKAEGTGSKSTEEQEIPTDDLPILHAEKMLNVIEEIAFTESASKEERHLHLHDMLDSITPDHMEYVVKDDGTGFTFQNVPKQARETFTRALTEALGEPFYDRSTEKGNVTGWRSYKDGSLLAEIEVLPGNEDEGVIAVWGILSPLN